jgi:Ethanolamine utilization protein EutJ (predicted chaperonin)
MKLFQIEEPDGSPPADAPGMAVGIELSAAKGAAVAVAVGGNAELLVGADGERRIAAARLDDKAALAELLLRLRERAEKALARPVTHAVVALGAGEASVRDALGAAAEAAGLTLLRLVDAATAAARAPGAAAADAPALGAAIQAEDDAAPLLR